MIEDRLDPIRSLYEAFATGDMGRVIAETDWEEAEGMPYSGRYRPLPGTGKAGAVDVAFPHLWTILGGRIVRFVQYADTHRFRQAVPS